MRQKGRGPFLLFLFLLGVCLSCKPLKLTGGPYYFNRGSVQDAFRPNDQLTLDQAKQLGDYNEVYFNDRGSVTKLTHFEHGKIVYLSIYYYRPDGKLDSGDFKKYDSNGNQITNKSKR